MTRLPARTPEKGGAARPARSHGRRYLAIGLAGLVLVGFAAWSLRDLARPRREASPQPQVARLLADAISTRVQLAQRRLDAGDFEAAIKAAQSALNLDEKNADAKAVLEEASGRAERAKKAALALHEAQARRGDVAGAAFELMKIDPAHLEAEKAAQASGAAFRPRSEEARSEAANARTAAVGAGASSLPAFTEATALESQGQQALQSKQFGLAARRFFEARIRFERAARAARRP